MTCGLGWVTSSLSTSFTICEMGILYLLCPIWGLNGMNEHESLEPGKVIVNSQAPRLDEQDFPSGPVDKNLSANAGDMSSIPGPGRFHMPWDNYWACARATTTDSHALESVLPKKRRQNTTTREKPMLAAIRESTLAVTKPKKEWMGSPLLPCPPAHLLVQFELSNKSVGLGTNNHRKVQVLQSNKPGSEVHWPRILGLRKASKTKRSASWRPSRRAHIAGSDPQNPRKGGVFLLPTLCLLWVLDCQTITIFLPLLLGPVQIRRPLPWAVGDRLWGRRPGQLYFTFIHWVIQQMFTQKTKVPNLSFPVHCLCDLGWPPQNPLNLQSEENGSQLEAGQTWVPAVGESLALTSSGQSGYHQMFVEWQSDQMNECTSQPWDENLNAQRKE